MKAVVWTKYGPPDVLQLKEIAKPTPKDNEILVKVHASTVVAGDCEMRRFELPLLFWLPARLYLGVLTPGDKILGQEFAGEIEAVGKDVTTFKPGDHVFGLTDFGAGAYTEYICRPVTSDQAILSLKPANITSEEAAAVPVGGFEVLHFMRAARIKPGERVLINGAGGSIGTLAVQFAKHLGAEVTAVDSAEKLPMLRSIGADHVMDYQQTNFIKNGHNYDVIFDVVSKSVRWGGLRSLKSGGRYVLVNFSVLAMLHGALLARMSSKRIITGISSRSAETFETLKTLLASGAIKAIIDKRYPLEQTAEAHRYVDTGQKKGSVVITVGA